MHTIAKKCMAKASDGQTKNIWRWNKYTYSVQQSYSFSSIIITLATLKLETLNPVCHWCEMKAFWNCRIVELSNRRLELFDFTTIFFFAISQCSAFRSENSWVRSAIVDRMLEMIFGRLVVSLLEMAVKMYFTYYRSHITDILCLRSHPVFALLITNNEEKENSQKCAIDSPRFFFSFYIHIVRFAVFAVIFALVG